MTGSAQPTFAEVDQHLREVLRRHDHDPVWPTCLAVLAAADRAGYRPSLVRAWLRPRADHRPEVIAAAESHTTWSRIVAVHRGWARRRRTDDHQRTVRIAIARRAVGVLLAEPPAGVSPVAALGARAVAVDIAVRALESGIDAPLTPLPALGARLGAERSTARRWLRTAEAADWVRQVGQRAGSAQALRLGGAVDASARELVLDHAEVVDALADRDTNHLAATALLAAGHPWFAYGPLGLRGWAVLTLSLVGADLDQLGSPRLARAAVRDLDRAGLLVAEWTGPELLAELDRLADRTDGDGWTSPAMRARTAHETVAAQTAARVASLQTIRAEKASAAAARRAASDSRPDRQAAAAAEVVRAALPADWTGSAADHEKLRILADRKGMVVVAVDDAARVATLTRAADADRRSA